MDLVCYGSNIWSTAFKNRAKTARNPRPVLLHDYELIFRAGYATIRKRQGATCPCVIWEIDEIDLPNVDYYEGYPAFYDRVELSCGNVYVMQEKFCGDLTLPSRAYVETIAKGYNEFSLKTTYLSMALEEIGKEIEYCKLLNETEE